MQVKTLACLFVGADGFEPPKSKDSRFTVCPIWPLWKTPVSVYLSGRLGIRTPDPLLVRQML